MPAADPRRVTRCGAGLGVLFLVLALPAACEDDEPFPGCPGEERVPALCGVETTASCSCNTCGLDDDGRIACLPLLSTFDATCRTDGSDWETCGCSTAQPRSECQAACETMRCAEACDANSVLSCIQRCQDFFDDYETHHGGPPDEACAVAIATLAVCLPGGGCPQAPLCEDATDTDSQRDLYDSECGSD